MCGCTCFSLHGCHIFRSMNFLWLFCDLSSRLWLLNKDVFRKSLTEISAEIFICMSSADGLNKYIRTIVLISVRMSSMRLSPDRLMLSCWLTARFTQQHATRTEKHSRRIEVTVSRDPAKPDCFLFSNVHYQSIYDFTIHLSCQF